jgi:hypothetical protein
MRKDKAGNKLYRKMTVKIIFPDNLFPDRTYLQHAGPQRGFGPDGIDQMLDQIATELDSLYPWWEFKPVELMPIGSTIRFAFIFAGNNHNYAPPIPESILPKTDEGTTLTFEPPTKTEVDAAIEAPTILQDLAAAACVPEEEQNVRADIEDSAR